MPDSAPTYTVHLDFTDAREYTPRATIELTPAEIPRKGDLIGWTARRRAGYLRFRVTEVMWCLDPSAHTDREVYLTLVEED